MFLGLVVATCVFAGEGTPPPKTPAATSRLDIRRAVQWIFGKQPTPTKEPTEPRSSNDVELTDSRLELKCRSNVFGDPALRATGMTVKVIGGVAYLEGVATTRWQRLRAEQLAQRTPGIKRVENQLRLDEGGIAAPTESQAAAANPPDTQVETVAAEARAPSVVVSRPKSLPKSSEEPAVTTYTIRRSGEKSSDFQNASAAAKPNSKRTAGKLVPWNEEAPTEPSSWLETIGVVSATAPSPIKKADLLPSLEPLDLAVQRALSASTHGNGLTFERSGGHVVLRGAAPATAKLKIAQEIGRVTGIATVSIDSGINEKP